MVRVLIALVVVALAAPVALAQETPPSAEDMDAAKIHFQAGSEHYARNNYPQAILEFKEAYRLSHLAQLLYNMSEAYEKEGDYVNARDSLKQYMDSGQTDAGEMPNLEAKLKSFNEKIAAAAAKPPEVKPPVNTQPVVIVPVEPKTPYRTWKWVAAGTGAGFLVLATLVGVDASNMNKKINDAANKSPLNQYSTDLQADYARGKRDNGVEALLAIGGVALIGTGVVLFIMDSHARNKERAMESKTVVLPMITPNTAGAAVMLRF